MREEFAVGVKPDGAFSMQRYVLKIMVPAYSYVDAETPAAAAKMAREYLANHFNGEAYLHSVYTAPISPYPPVTPIAA